MYCILEKQWRQQWAALSHGPQGAPITCTYTSFLDYSGMQLTIDNNDLNQLEVDKIACVLQVDREWIFNS